MLTGNIGFIKENAGVYRIHLNNLTHNYNTKYDISTIRELENLKQYSKDKYHISEDIMSKWIDFRIFKYLYWRISSSDNKQLEELRTLFNDEIKIKYPNAYNELQNIMPI